MDFFIEKLRPILVLVAVIWFVEIVNFSLGHRLTAWGVLPRNLGGLIGIPLAPFIHAGFWHAVSNTIPFIILGSLVMTAGRSRFWSLTVGITLLSGALVWLFARGRLSRGCKRTDLRLFRRIVGPRSVRTHHPVHGHCIRDDHNVRGTFMGSSADLEPLLVRRPFVRIDRGHRHRLARPQVPHHPIRIVRRYGLWERCLRPAITGIVQLVQSRLRASLTS